MNERGKGGLARGKRGAEDGSARGRRGRTVTLERATHLDVILETRKGVLRLLRHLHALSPLLRGRRLGGESPARGVGTHEREREEEEEEE